MRKRNPPRVLVPRRRPDRARYVRCGRIKPSAMADLRRFFEGQKERGAMGLLSTTDLTQFVLDGGLTMRKTPCVGKSEREPAAREYMVSIRRPHPGWTSHRRAVACSAQDAAFQANPEGFGVVVSVEPVAPMQRPTATYCGPGIDGANG